MSFRLPLTEANSFYSELTYGFYSFFNIRLTTAMIEFWFQIIFDDSFIEKKNLFAFSITSLKDYQ